MIPNSLEEFINNMVEDEAGGDLYCYSLRKKNLEQFIIGHKRLNNLFI